MRRRIASLLKINCQLLEASWVKSVSESKNDEHAKVHIMEGTAMEGNDAIMDQKIMQIKLCLNEK